MTIREFTYKKTDGTVHKYRVLIVEDKPDHFFGISLDSLTQPELARLTAFEKLPEKLEPAFMKHFKKFSRKSVLSILKETK
jgi:membrane carboxypeptidase/penicillin-binding protein